MKEQKNLFEMLKQGVTPFGCVKESLRRLNDAGFEEISYSEEWKLKRVESM